MGITGLIPFLEKASSKTHLKHLRGSTVAVDTYCWLHKGVYACAEKLVRGEATDQHIKYCLKYVELLLSYDIKPILVFDGRHLPAKALTEQRRRESRAESKKRAAELLRLGYIEEARSHMRRCVDVTHKMALCLIRECRQRNVDCIVAPYEADAQMAWLNKVDLAQYVITEDSDLMLFGSKKVIFKLDLTGAGLMVEANKLCQAMGCREEKYTFDKFLRMCILSGCDYLDSLPGIGLSKACKFILKTEETDMRRALKKLPQYLNIKSLKVYDDYIEEFLKAEATFKHMYIYNPIKRKMERLNDLKEFQTDEEYCSNAGVLLESDELAFELALGNLHPFSLMKLDDWHPDNNNEHKCFGNIKRTKHISIWQIERGSQLQTLINDAPTREPVNCALYFKKIDFISRTLREDISARIEEENAKPEETEIFSFYKHTAEESELCQKRKRTEDKDSTRIDDDDNELSEPPSPIALKSHYNPFAKCHSSTEKQKSPTVCENTSLLKALSPSKRKSELLHQTTRLNSLKRSIFITKEVHEAKIEVKSRFFADNLKRARISSSPVSDLAKEMEMIEARSEQNQMIQAQLYNSPSPIKLKKITEEPTMATANTVDNRIEFLNLDSSKPGNESTNAEEHKTEVGTDKAESETKGVENTTVRDEDVVVILDDSNDPWKSDISRKKLNDHKPAVGARLGLSKPKVGGSGAYKKRTLTRSVSDVTRTQTSLAMFGFQKRPTLK